MKLAWKQVIIAFLLGGFIGAALGGPLMWHWRRQHWSAGRMQQHLLNQFSRKLQLTNAQRTQVAAILEGKRQKMDALRAEIRPRFEELRTSTSAEIRQVLTPEQQQKFDALQQKWDARIKRFRGDGMGPGGP